MLVMLVSCASMSKQTNRIVQKKGSLKEKSLIKNIALIKQKTNHCGPATLAMAIHHLGKNLSLDTISNQTFTARGEGTFKTDMLATARRQGLIAIPINSMENLIQEISAGNPVIVFQNVGLSWYPKWHYALVVGHDLTGPDIYLHTGNQSYSKTDMRSFERTWNLAKYWGVIVLPPNRLSMTGSELVHVEATANLENLGLNNQSKEAYQAILKKWPKSLAGLIGLSNTLYSQKEYKSAVYPLKKILKLHPKYAVAWHNLAFAQLKLGENKNAQQSAQKAIQYAAPEEIIAFKENLKDLTPNETY